MKKEWLTKELAESLFYYKDGVLYWKDNRGYCHTKDKPVGSVTKAGYFESKLNLKTFKVHRVVFLLHHGYLPEVIDHIDGNKIYFSKSLPYIPHSNSYVDCHGSKAGYSPGGLIYPTPSGNKMSDFKSVMLNDEVSVNDIHGSDIALKPGQFFYLWIRRVVLPGVKNVSGENFMPKFKFEVS